MYGLYRNYLANEDEKEQLKKLEGKAYIDSEENKKIKYNPDDIFKNKVEKKKDFNEEISNRVDLIEYNESLFKKIWNKILRILKK